MARSQKPSSGAALKAIHACIENGERLLEESHDLEFRKPPSSRFFLIMISQEEFAKAFIMFLVKEDIMPLSPPILRAAKDHACKQLVGLIMDYMIMHWDDIEELKVLVSNDCDLGDRLPSDVASAVNLLRHEKIGRWESNTWVWAEEPNYDASALRIAEGKKDRRKQDALYVRFGSDGQVCSTPQAITEEETCDEFERAYRFKNFVNSVLDGGAPSPRYDKVIAVLKILFEERRRVAN